MECEWGEVIGYLIGFGLCVWYCMRDIWIFGSLLAVHKGVKERLRNGGGERLQPATLRPPKHTKAY